MFKVNIVDILVIKFFLIFFFMVELRIIIYVKLLLFEGVIKYVIL